METRQCPVCKTVNAEDAERCILCGQILDQSAEPVESSMPTRKLSPPKAAPISPESTQDTGQDDASPKVHDIGKESSKLRSLLSSKSKAGTLQDLDRQGLLLPEDNQTVSAADGEYTDPGETPGGLIGATLPDWLRSSEFGQVGDQKPTEQESVEEQQSPLPAELPDWVKKLQGNVGRSESKEGASLPPPSKPKQVDPDETPEVIPPESPPPRPRAVFQAIVLPDQAMIDSLKSYLKELRSSRKIPADQSQRRRKLSWGAIGMAMIGLIAVLSWPGTMVANLPQTPEPQLASINQFIEQLPPESVVLLGIDYDLPLAGEMENACLPVIAHLMSKQVRLVFIPTRPTGPAMAEHLASLGLKWQPDFPPERVFLGSYLIGGAVGLSSFAMNPRATLPLGADGLPFWSRPGLEHVEALKDLSMVLLITDSLESGRDWIEQVQPWMDSVPLEVVSSSQAAPLLQPYVASGQIQSLISGIVGGASYERMTLLTTSNQLMLRPYRGGLAFMIVLMGSSLIVATLLPEKWFSSRKGRRNDATR